jgi:bifunctional DNA-binding transcriptional regulator/antitoxin component of YhaV-PrlF toxin-antitoxin module
VVELGEPPLTVHEGSSRLELPIPAGGFLLELLEPAEVLVENVGHDIVVDVAVSMSQNVPKSNRLRRLLLGFPRDDSPRPDSSPSAVLSLLHLVRVAEIHHTCIRSKLWRGIESRLVERFFDCVTQDAPVSTETDKQGRLYIPKEVREKYGERYHIVTYEERIELIPVADDPLAAVRAAAGELRDASVGEIREDIEDEATADARSEDGR